MAFFTSDFPLPASKLMAKSSWRTIVTEVGSGAEGRTGVWADARRQYEVKMPNMTLTNWLLLEKHFNAMRGQLHSFPLVDRFLSTATTEPFGTGDGVTSNFQLTINMGDASNAYNREIYKPTNDGTIRVFVNALLKTETTHYVVNYSRGLVAFTAGNIPTLGQSLTWTGNFKVPVRYMTDELDPNLLVWSTSGSQIVDGPSIHLIETRDIT